MRRFVQSAGQPNHCRLSSWPVFKFDPADLSNRLCVGLTCAWLHVGARPALADETSNAAPADEKPASTASLLPMPTMAGPLTANQTPEKIDFGELGNVSVSGVLSGFAQ